MRDWALYAMLCQTGRDIPICPITYCEAFRNCVDNVQYLALLHSSITCCCVRSGELGCGHYKRKCKVVAPCCDRAYTCRECHDEAEPDHEMDSKAVDTMVCMDCNTRQHAARASLRLSLTICTSTANLFACVLRAL